MRCARSDCVLSATFGSAIVDSSSYGRHTPCWCVNYVRIIPCSLQEPGRDVKVGHISGRVIQFSGPAPVSLFPPPEMGEGEGGGAGRWRAQAVLLPPIPTFPRQGGRGRSPREARGKSRTEWPWQARRSSLTQPVF